jgi:hypothetical protein
MSKLAIAVGVTILLMGVTMVVSWSRLERPQRVAR